MLAARQPQLEDASSSRVTKIILDAAAVIPFPWPLRKVIEKFQEASRGGFHRPHPFDARNLRRGNSEARNKNRTSTPTLSGEAADARAEITRELLPDGARKAESTRAKERVRRIGLILAHTIAEPKPADADEVETMMRVAMEPSDRDVDYLRELIRIEGEMLESRDHIDRYLGNMAVGEAASIGLVVRIAPPNNLNRMADFQNRYVLLKKALRFATLIRDATAD